MNYFKIILGGVERGLKFNLGTLRFIGELTGTDPLRFQDSSEDVGEQYRIIKTLIHAGLLSNCMVKKVDPDFTVEDIDAWVCDLAPYEGKEVLLAWNAAMAAERSPEDSKKKRTVKMP